MVSHKNVEKKIEYIKLFLNEECGVIISNWYHSVFDFKCKKAHSLFRDSESEYLFCNCIWAYNTN